MPFLTERLWQQLNEIAPQRGLPGFADLEISPLAVTAKFPPDDGYPALEDKRILEVFGEMQDVVRGVRELRNGCEVSPKQKVDITVALPDEHRQAFEKHEHIVHRMANVENLTVDPDAKRPPNAGSVTFGPLRVYVHDISDDQAERTRATKALAQVEKQVAGKQSKLANEKFVSNAKPEVVEAERKRLAELIEQRDSLQTHLDELAS